MAKGAEDARDGKQTDAVPELPPPKKLPKSLQDTLDNEESLWSTLYEGNAPESTDSSVRYAGYAARLRTIMLSAHRYVAYTSDIGESFRPIAHPILVRSAYSISWAYIAGDVGYEGYKAYIRNQHMKHPEKYVKEEDKAKVPASALVPRAVPPLEDYRTVVAQRAIFQSIASMGLPAFTIHSIVKYSGRAMKDIKNKTIRTWGPIGLGLAAVPFLPYLFDKPVEEAVEWTFHKGFEVLGRNPGSVKEKEL